MTPQLMFLDGAVHSKMYCSAQEIVCSETFSKETGAGDFAPAKQLLELFPFKGVR
jgi:hypothetical protein